MKHPLRIIHGAVEHLFDVSLHHVFVAVVFRIGWFIRAQLDGLVGGGGGAFARDSIWRRAGFFFNVGHVRAVIHPFDAGDIAAVGVDLDGAERLARFVLQGDDPNRNAALVYAQGVSDAVEIDVRFIGGVTGNTEGAAGIKIELRGRDDLAAGGTAGRLIRNDLAIRHLHFAHAAGRAAIGDENVPARRLGIAIDGIDRNDAAEIRAIDLPADQTQRLIRGGLALREGGGGGEEEDECDGRSPHGRNKSAPDARCPPVFGCAPEEGDVNVYPACPRRRKNGSSFPVTPEIWL